MMLDPFDCPVCLQRFYRDAASVYDERYDDTVCELCKEEPICEYWLEGQKKSPLNSVEE